MYKQTCIHTYIHTYIHTNAYINVYMRFLKNNKLSQVRDYLMACDVFLSHDYSIIQYSYSNIQST